MKQTCNHHLIYTISLLEADHLLLTLKRNFANVHERSISSSALTLHVLGEETAGLKCQSFSSASARPVCRHVMPAAKRRAGCFCKCLSLIPALHNNLSCHHGIWLWGVRNFSHRTNKKTDSGSAFLNRRKTQNYTPRLLPGSYRAQALWKCMYMWAELLYDVSVLVLSTCL